MSRRNRLPRRSFLSSAASGAAALAANALVAAPAHAATIPAKWDQETDVVIIGSGIAGMCAAIEAVDAGAKVKLLEKDAQPYGAAKFSGGHMTGGWGERPPVVAWGSTAARASRRRVRSDGHTTAFGR